MVTNAVLTTQVQVHEGLEVYAEEYLRLRLAQSFHLTQRVPEAYEASVSREGTTLTVSMRPEVYGFMSEPGDHLSVVKGILGEISAL